MYLSIRNRLETRGIELVCAPCHYRCRSSRNDKGAPVATTPRSSRTAPGHGTVRAGVFICYRHEDSPGQALRVYQLLSSKFGEDRVFMDLTIPGGVDFPEWIERSVGAAGVVTPIIGRSWLVREADGARRIDDERDFVRGEIVGALERGIHVLPVLVDDAEMPSEEELPASLARLPYLNAHVLRSDVYWRESNEKLVARVAELLGEPVGRPADPVQPTPPPERLPASVTAAGVTGAALLVIGLVLLWNTYITPGFPYLPLSPGVFTAWAPLAILAGALVALARVRGSAAPAWLDAGLLAGFGFEAAVKGLSLLGESDARGQVGGMLWLAGGAALGVAAAVAANHYRTQAPAEAQPELRRSTAVVGVLGAVLLVVGTLISFNVASPGGSHTVTSDGHSIETIGTALAALGAVALLLTGRRALAAGLLIALGLGSALLWVRYTGIPVAQWLHTSGRHASPRAGGFVGLAGSLLIFASGWRLAVSSRAEIPAAAPLPTT
jgi:hypothetical protein